MRKSLSSGKKQKSFERNFRWRRGMAASLLGCPAAQEAVHSETVQELNQAHLYTSTPPKCPVVSSSFTHSCCTAFTSTTQSCGTICGRLRTCSQRRLESQKIVEMCQHHLPCKAASTSHLCPKSWLVPMAWSRCHCLGGAYDTPSFILPKTWLCWFFAALR